MRALREIQAPQHITSAPDHPVGVRISSAAFRPGTDGSVSVDLEESLARSGLALTARFPAMAGAVGLAALPIDAIRAHGLVVVHDPIPGNDHHGEIRSGVEAIGKNAWRRIAREMAERCEIIVPISGAAE